MTRKNKRMMNHRKVNHAIKIKGIVVKVTFICNNVYNLTINVHNWYSMYVNIYPSLPGLIRAWYKITFLLLLGLQQIKILFLPTYSVA